MRFSTTIDTFNGAGKNGRQNEIAVTYRGTTSNNTATELFLDGVSPRRLVPDFPSGGVLKYLTFGYNLTDNSPIYGETVVSYSVSAAGVIALFDQDSVTAGSQDQPTVPVTVAGTRAGFLLNNVASDFGVFVDVVPAVVVPQNALLNVPAYLRLQVRGTSNKTFIWESHVTGLEVTGTGA